jgi:hypothetical protein
MPGPLFLPVSSLLLREGVERCCPCLDGDPTSRRSMQATGRPLANSTDIRPYCYVHRRTIRPGDVSSGRRLISPVSTAPHARAWIDGALEEEMVRARVSRRVALTGLGAGALALAATPASGAIAAPANPKPIQPPSSIGTRSRPPRSSPTPARTTPSRSCGSRSRRPRSTTPSTASRGATSCTNGTPAVRGGPLRRRPPSPPPTGCC